MTREQLFSGESHEQIDISHDRPLASEAWGTTAAEQRVGEPLEVRLAHEEPDRVEGMRADGADVSGDAGLESASRLVEPDEGTHTDDQTDRVARSVGVDGGGLTAEEAAVHIVDEPDGPR